MESGGVEKFWDLLLNREPAAQQHPEGSRKLPEIYTQQPTRNNDFMLLQGMRI